MVMSAERHLIKCLPQLELKNNKVAYLFSCPWPNSKENPTNSKGKTISNSPVFALDIGILLIPVKFISQDAV